MRTYWNINEILRPIEEWQPNCWIQVTCPTEEDQQELEERFQIPDYFLQDVSDTDERARYEYDDGWMLIILRIPYVKEIRSRTPYTTVPLGIIHKRDVTITVCYYETNMMIDFVSYQQKRGSGFTDYVDLTFRLFLSSAVWYLKRLKQINTLIEKAKHNHTRQRKLVGQAEVQVAGRRTGCRPDRRRQHRDDAGPRDHQHLRQHPRIDHGHVLEHYQQQREHGDENPYFGFHSDDVNYPGGITLRHERHQRHGNLQVWFYRSLWHFHPRGRGFMGHHAPQTTAVDRAWTDSKTDKTIKKSLLFRKLAYFYISLQHLMPLLSA